MTAKSPQILLVEDNPDDADLTLRAFSKSKVETAVFVVRDGQEALDYLFAQGTHANRDATDLPRIVLLDLNLPKLGGLDVLRAMRSNERTRRLPVVVLTSSTEENDVLRSYDLGANSYVRKPVDFSHFLDAAKQLGQYWLVLNHAPPLGADTRGDMP
ncbi:MAG TPA: response regulator [Polyangiales bacterium]|nr:response regulator [Polyangiales bacterium]